MTAVIYTTPSCAYCPRVRKFLTDNLVEFTERNVNVPEVGKEAFELSGGMLTVPITLIIREDGTQTVIVGWNYAKLKEAIA